MRCSSVQRVVKHCLTAVAAGALPAAEGAAALRWANDEAGGEGGAVRTTGGDGRGDGGGGGGGGSGAALLAELRGASAAEVRWLAAEVRTATRALGLPTSLTLAHGIPNGLATPPPRSPHGHAHPTTATARPS